MYCLNDVWKKILPFCVKLPIRKVCDIVELMQIVVVKLKIPYLTSLKRNRVKLQDIRGLIRNQTDNDAIESEEKSGVFFS